MFHVQFLVFFLFSVIFTVNCQLPNVDSAAQIMLDEISGGDQNLWSNDPVIDLKTEVKFFFTNR